MQLSRVLGVLLGQGCREVVHEPEVRRDVAHGLELDTASCAARRHRPFD